MSFIDILKIYNGDNIVSGKLWKFSRKKLSEIFPKKCEIFQKIVGTHNFSHSPFACFHREAVSR